MKTVLETAHWEPRRGSQQQAIAYCSKSETKMEGPWSVGTPKEQGKRNDLEEIKNKILEGVEEKEISLEHFSDWTRYHKAFERFRLIHSTPRNEPQEVIVCIGKTGTGKTKYAQEFDPKAYWKEHGKWWDGYTNQNTIIIDEFYGWIPFTELLRVCDRYTYRGETKGGTVNIVSKTVIITSNKEPDDWYTNCYFDAFKRRVTKWRRFNNMVGSELGEIITFISYDEFKKNKNEL